MEESEKGSDMAEFGEVVDEMSNSSRDELQRSDGEGTKASKKRFAVFQVGDDNCPDRMLD